LTYIADIAEFLKAQGLLPCIFSKNFYTILTLIGVKL